MKKITLIIVMVISAFQFMSCSKPTETISAPVTWTDTVIMSTKFEVPAIGNRPETAIAELQILSDNTLKYSIIVSNLVVGDVLASAHIHLGNAATSGPVYISLDGTFSGSVVSGKVQLTAGQADTIKTGETYVNVHTTQVSGGLIRGQIDSKVVFAGDIAMNGANEVPAISTTATGHAIIRMTDSKKLYVKVTVNNLEAGDVLSGSHIHSGNATINGTELLVCYSVAADFGTVKKITIDDALYNSLLTAPMYIHAFSITRSNLIRGQIR